MSESAGLSREAIQKKNGRKMTLYGFFYSSCLYESSYGLFSLHQTKAGAYRAMVTAQRAEWEKARDERYVNRFRGLKRRHHFDYRFQRQFEGFKVSPVEVLP